MPSSAHPAFEHAIEALYGLHIGIVGTEAGRHERPHKPVLMLAVLDLIAQGRATPDRIPWCQPLRDRFTAYFEIVRKANDQDTPENPFFFMRQEGWWKPWRQMPSGVQPLQGTPLVGDMAGGAVWASIHEPITPWLLTSAHRMQMREALVSRFFPAARASLLQLGLDHGLQEVFPGQPGGLQTEAEEGAEERPGRSAAFRRVVLGAYDHQCAACGLRIRMPQREDLTFVDAAHLIPFGDASLGGNDHPTNGMALCKNHHWAMDRFLIAPTPEGIWMTSALLDARRSRGEAELLHLQRQPVLLPHEKAFHPSAEALQWRIERLAA